LATALGHLILHRKVQRSHFASNTDAPLLKGQARQFARAFLLPETSFPQDVYAISLDALRLIKQKWRVPIGVMISRLADIGMVTSEQAQRLWMTRSKRGWRSSEPLDEEIKSERPRLLAEAINLIVEEHIETKQDILSNLLFSDRDVEVLAALPTGYITDTMPVVAIVPPRQARLDLSIGSAAPVIQFPDNVGATTVRRRKLKAI
jgi:Zn-dependent peptidase ImmA (M78 family)